MLIFERERLQGGAPQTKTQERTKKMSYEEALKEAEENAANFPQWEENGTTLIKVNGRVYPKGWFVRTAARMKMNGEI